MTQSARPLQARILIGALVWLACLEFFLIPLVVQGATTGYSPRDHDLSYLGLSGCGTFTDPITRTEADICSPLHLWFNISLTLLGALMIIGLLLTRPLWPRGKLTKVGHVFYAVAGLGAMAAGVWPVDVSMPVHIAGAMLNFLLGSIGMVLLGLALRNHAPGPATIGLAIGIITLAGFALYGAGIYLGLGRGGMERVGAYAATLWPPAMGLMILSGRLRPPAEA